MAMAGSPRAPFNPSPSWPLDCTPARRGVRPSNFRSRRCSTDWEAVERLSPCGGIRIEDDLAIGTEGAVNLSRAAFAQA